MKRKIVNDFNQKELLQCRLSNGDKHFNYYDLGCFLDKEKQIMLWHFIQRNFKSKFKRDENVYIDNKRKYKKNVLYYSLDEVINLISIKIHKHKTQVFDISDIFKNFLLFFSEYKVYFDDTIRHKLNVPKPKYIRKLWRVWYYIRLHHKDEYSTIFNIFSNYLSLKEMKSKKLNKYKEDNIEVINLLFELDREFSSIKSIDDIKSICPEQDVKVIQILNDYMWNIRDNEDIV